MNKEEVMQQLDEVIRQLTDYTQAPLEGIRKALLILDTLKRKIINRKRSLNENQTDR